MNPIFLPIATLDRTVQAEKVIHEFGRHTKERNSMGVLVELTA